MARKKKEITIIVDNKAREGLASIGIDVDKEIEAGLKLANVPSNGWPKMNQGTHLTVKTFEDGRTELIWDDEQLLKEVTEATSKYEYSEPKTVINDDGSVSKVVTVTKKTKGKKNVSTQ